MDTKQNDGKVFKNRLLERFTHTHIAVPLTIFYGTGLILLGYSIYLGILGTSASIGLFLIGLFSFTLLEYLVHRYAFHLEPHTEATEKFQYAAHGVHHDFPKDKSRLAMPPFVSMALATGFFFLYRFVMGDIGVPFTGGFLAGYAAYLTVHYIVHAYRAPNNMFKILWTHHAIHHHVENDRAFGVSSPLWDVVFRTMPRSKAKRTTATRT